MNNGESRGTNGNGNGGSDIQRVKRRDARIG